MFRKLTFIVILLFLVPTVALAQGGKLRGMVTDKETGDPLPGANVLLEGTTLGASTDLNGVYVVLAVPPGVYAVRASYMGYQEMEIANIRVMANLTTTQDFALSPTAIAGEAVEIIAERPLIQRNTTNTVRMTTQEDIQNVPIRGMQNLLALNAGTVLQDGVLHVRGGREFEVATFIDNATATIPYVEVGTGGRGMQSQNPEFGADPTIGVIQEAVEEVQMQSGGYTAEFGGGNSAIVRTTMRSGGTDYSVTLDYRTDDFVHSGEKFFNTSSFGYRNGVLTLSGPVPGISRLKFFVAGQHNYWRNRTPGFIEPFRFEGLTDDGFEGRTVGDTLPNNGIIEYKRNYLPSNWQKDNSIQGTLVYELSNAIKLRFTGSFNDVRNLNQGQDFNSSLFNYFNLGRNPERLDQRLLTSLRATHVLSPTTFYELTMFFTNRTGKTYDPEFGDNWRAYVDSIANYEKGYTGWQKRFLGPRLYSTINNFEFAAPGAPVNSYEKNSQMDIGASLDFTTQLTKNWELKAGGRFDQWTMRRYNIRAIRQLLTYEFGESGKYPIDWAGEASRLEQQRLLQINEAQRLENEGKLIEAQALRNSVGPEITADYLRWVRLARTGDRLRPIIYGYDIDGNEINDSPNGPREPFFGAFYIQNKFEFRDLIVNLGLRYERIDINDVRPKDLLNPHFDGLLDWISEKDMVETEPFDYWLPRLTFSFPVTDRTVFYALYGKYVQMPPLSIIYHGIPKISHSVSPVTRDSYGYFGQWVGFAAEPEHTTQYEMGIRQSITENFAFTLTGFYKDLRNLLRWDVIRVDERGEIDPDGDVVFAGRVNNDFSTIKGVELTLELRRTKRLATRVNYTLSDSRGTGSDSRSSQVVVSDDVIATYPTLIYNLDYHQPHRGSVMLDYRFDKGDGGKILEGLGLNLLLNFNSGHSYTKVAEPENLGQATPWNVGVRALSDPRNRHPEEPLNSSLTPWNFTVDLNLNRVFYFGRFNVDVYMNVLNLFDAKNVINVYPMTGTAEDDGWLRAPLAASFLNIPSYVDFYNAINSDNRWAFQGIYGQDLYGTPRQIRFGVRFEFK